MDYVVAGCQFELHHRFYKLSLMAGNHPRIEKKSINSNLNSQG